MSQRSKVKEKVVELTEKQKNMLAYGKRHAKKTVNSSGRSFDEKVSDPRRLAMEQIDQESRIDVSETTITDLLMSKVGEKKNHYFKRDGKKFSKPLRGLAEAEVVEPVVKPVRKPRTKKVVPDVSIES